MPVRGTSVSVRSSAVTAHVEELLEKVRQTIRESRAIQEQTQTIIERVTAIRSIDPRKAPGWNDPR